MTGTAVCLGLLAPATAVAATQTALAALGRFPRRRQSPQTSQPPAIVVLIPAHDEEATIGAALKSVAEQDSPAVYVVVVADNCTDRTADVAARYGARVVTRTDDARRGKGYAVAAGLHALRDDSFDAVLILDADCTLNRAALTELATTLAAGARVVQASLRSRNADAGPGGFVAAVGSAVDAAVAAGRERVGLPGRLRGTGMAFCRSALGCVRWATASPVEDAEYERQLRDAGVRVSYCPGAAVSAAAPTRLTDLCRQRRRWAAAGPGESKPLGLALAVAAVTTALVTGQFVGWACGLAVTLILLYGGAVAEVGLTRRRLAFALAAPAVVVRLLCVAVAGWLKPDRGWEPARAG